MSAPSRKRKTRQPAASATPARTRRSATAAEASGAGRHLVIVESPAKAETIGRFLADGYVVEASYGHIRDLPGNAQERPAALKGKPWAELAVNVDEDFDPVYIVLPDKKAQVARLKKALKKADKLLLATDEDREGESICWHLVEVLNPQVPVERIVFHEVTREAIEQALESPRAVDQNLVEAQETRRILDRLFGYSLSPVLWRKISAGLSAGRVQSVAMRLLVLRERERAAFHSGDYWDIEARLHADGGPCTAVLRRLGDARMPAGRDFDPTTGRLTTAGVRRLDETEVQTLLGRVQALDTWRVRSVEAAPLTRRPAPPFTTSTLQQEGNRKLGFSARRTMQVAQSLYEGVGEGEERTGLITYMRTDSVTLSQEALREAQTVIGEQFGADFAAGPRHYRTKTRNAQEAHEAIRPTDLRRTPDTLRHLLNRDQQRLYELIWQRTVASQMADAKLERTVVEIEAPVPDGPAIFEARSNRVTFAGFLRAYTEGQDDTSVDEDAERLLPPLHEGDRLRPQSLTPKRHETQPPARFTEASLVRKLEEDGLGRPSTYAAIIGTILERGYAFKQGSALVPTFVAYAVTDLLERHFGDLVEPAFTADMEETLDAIARGETDCVSHLREFYHGDSGGRGLASRIETELPNIAFPMLSLNGEQDPGPSLDGAQTEAPAIVVRIGRYGPYLQRGEGGEGHTASLPPDLAPADLTLDKARELLAAKQEGPRDLGRDPDTGLDVLLQTGRFGPYVQLGAPPPAGTRSADHPKRASVPREHALDEVTLEDALVWLSLPRTLGLYPDSGDPVVAASGRFGPYIQCGKETRSLGAGDDVYGIELARALQLLAEPKAANFRRRATSKVIAELGAHPDSSAPVRVMDGRYGPYATDGVTNASLPRGTEPATITLEQALTLLAERAARPPRGRRAAKKTAVKKTAAKKTTAKTTAKKPASKPKRPTTRKSSVSKPPSSG